MGKFSLAIPSFEYYSAERLKQSIMDKPGTHDIDLLEGCIKVGSLPLGKQLHSCIIKFELKQSTLLSNKFVNMYIKLRGLENAVAIFDVIPVRNVYSWTTIISGYAHHGYGESAIRLSIEMREEGLKPDKVTFVSILAACASTSFLEQGKYIHANILKEDGCRSNVFVGSRLVDMYAKCEEIEFAEKVFSSWISRNTVSWNTIIGAYVQHGDGNAALKMYNQMLQEGMKPNKVTYVCVLAACKCIRALAQGKLIHAILLEEESEPDLYICTTLVSMYATCGSIGESCQVFNMVPCQNVVLCNAMLEGLCQHSNGKEALNLFRQMQEADLELHKASLVIILSACTALASLEYGKIVHASILSHGWQTDVIANNTIMDMYAKCGSIIDAFMVFHRMRIQDVVSWNTMIGGYVQHGNAKQALILFWNMQQHKDITLDAVTFVSILCAYDTSPGQGKLLHAIILGSGFQTDLYVHSALVTMYANVGNMNYAQQVFDRIATRNFVMWNIMIGQYSHRQEDKLLIKLLKQMEQEGIKPDRITFMSTLSACAAPSSLGRAKMVHAAVLGSGLGSDPSVCNTLIGMYADCGCIESARREFNDMPMKDIVSCNAMLAVCIQHGNGVNSLELFVEMQRKGFTPTDISYITALNACACIAVVQQGRWIHAAILKDGIYSEVFIGSTLIDMYVKCGSIHEAQIVFDSLVEPNIVSWNVLIAGYAQHGHGRETLLLYKQMQLKSIQPDDITFISLLSVCSHVAFIEEGFHHFILMSELHNVTPTLHHYACMVDLLCSTGGPETGGELATQMPFQKDLPLYLFIFCSRN